VLTRPSGGLGRYRPHAFWPERGQFRPAHDRIADPLLLLRSRAFPTHVSPRCRSCSALMSYPSEVTERERAAVFPHADMCPAIWVAAGAIWVAATDPTSATSIQDANRPHWSGRSAERLMSKSTQAAEHISSYEEVLREAGAGVSCAAANAGCGVTWSLACASARRWQAAGCSEGYWPEALRWLSTCGCREKRTSQVLVLEPYFFSSP